MSQNETAAEKQTRIVAQARKEMDEREKGYREQALKMYPWVCGRCSREFNHKNLRELTVHHRDHNHDNNPPDGSNWELLCVYCHDNEHSRHADHIAAASGLSNDHEKKGITQNPFAALKDLMDDN
ncbi:MAG TPA: HNH nuclease family protein [Gammaproteobacteria bacterium]|nr:HNH nuclease family protein [Gammaproteobacteria bacterium]